MGSQTKLATYLSTDVGRVRTNNEDALAEDRDLGLLVLADGMGGYNAGEVASAIATSTVLEVVRRDWTESAAGARSEARTGLLERAIRTAHERIRDRAESNPDCEGMGTTAIACLIHEDHLAIAHVGDSRAYRWRQQQLQQLTRDHSLLEELVARGHYTREDANRLVRKNIVTRALGVETEVLIDLIEDRLQPGDLLLLCSDGLTDMLDDERIAAILGIEADLPVIGRSLIDTALAAGGRDNVSVALARIDDARVAGVVAEPSWHGRLRSWFAGGAA